MVLYVKIPEAPEVRRRLLEAKRDIYLQLHNVLEEIKNREKKLVIIDKALQKINEILQTIDELQKILPSREEIEQIEFMKKEKHEEIPVIVSSEEKSESENIELKRIEEELRKIEEELKKLL